MRGQLLRRVDVALQVPQVALLRGLALEEQASMPAARAALLRLLGKAAVEDNRYKWKRSG